MDKIPWNTILNIKATKQDGPRLFDKSKAFKSVIQMLNYEARKNSMLQKTSKFNIEEQENTITKQDYGRNQFSKNLRL